MGSNSRCCYQAFRLHEVYPGAGVGGHCIPIDPNYLSYEVRRRLGYPLRFVELAQEINNSMPSYVVERIAEKLNDKKRKLLMARQFCCSELPTSQILQTSGNRQLFQLLESYLSGKPMYGSTIRSFRSGTLEAAKALLLNRTCKRRFQMPISWYCCRLILPMMRLLFKRVLACSWILAESSTNRQIVYSLRIATRLLHIAKAGWLL